MKSSRLFIEILYPSSFNKRAFHPLVFRVENKYSCCFRQAESLSVLCHEIVEIFAFAVYYEIDVSTPFPAPLFLLPPLLNLAAVFVLVFLVWCLGSQQVRALIAGWFFLESYTRNGIIDFSFLRGLFDLDEIIDEIGSGKMVDKRMRFEEPVSGYIWRFAQT